jgi:transcriptional regulator with XRE-family HTH domain
MNNEKNTLEVVFGKVLSNLRREAEISQEVLALESDLDRSFISMLERGLRMPTIETLFKISVPLRIKPSDFIQLIENAHEADKN